MPGRMYVVRHFTRVARSPLSFYLFHGDFLSTYYVPGMCSLWGNRGERGSSVTEFKVTVLQEVKNSQINNKKSKMWPHREETEIQ